MAKQKESEDKLTPAETSRVSAAIKLSKEQEAEEEQAAVPAVDPAKDQVPTPNPALTPELKEELAAKWKNDTDKIEKDRFPAPPSDLSKNVVASGIHCPRCESTACSHAGGQRHCNQCGLTWH